MRIYEELFIVRPDATDEEIDPLIEQLHTLITGQGGSIIKTDKWGVRKLAYRVQKRTEGQYILMQFNGQPETVHELERRLRVADMVIKFITVRIDEKLKKIEKRKKEREKRASRKPAPVVAQPSVPADPSAIPGAPAAAGLTPGAPMPGAPALAPAAAPVTPPVGAPAPALAPVGAEKE